MAETRLSDLRRALREAMRAGDEEAVREAKAALAEHQGRASRALRKVDRDLRAAAQQVLLRRVGSR